MGPLFKRGGVQFAAYLSKSSSSSTSSYRCMSRSLAEGRAAGRSPFGAVRSYAEVASSEKSSLSAQTQKVRPISAEERKNMREREIHAMQIELEKLRNDFEKRNKESSERMQFQIEKLREKIMQSPPEELRSGIGSVISHIVQENTAKTTGTMNDLDEKIGAYIRLVDGRLDDVRDDLKKKNSLAMTVNLAFLSLFVIYHCGILESTVGSGISRWFPRRIGNE